MADALSCCGSSSGNGSGSGGVWNVPAIKIICMTLDILLYAGRVLLQTTLALLCIVLPYHLLGGKYLARAAEALVPWLRAYWRRGVVSFYEGKVVHKRTSPKPYRLEMPARMALVSIDHPPYWFQAQQRDHLTKEDARRIAGTSGSVYLLTTPLCFGCLMNPISVYFCFDDKPSGGGDDDCDGVCDGDCDDDCDDAAARRRRRRRRGLQCIAEVTNTPWGERVVFAFDPAGEQVPKALHVSPFMEIEDHSWIIKAALRDDRVMVSVNLASKDRGTYFYASYTGHSRPFAPEMSKWATDDDKDDGEDGQLSANGLEPPPLRAEEPHERRFGLRSEFVDLATMWRYGFQPQRVAMAIYGHALKLIGQVKLALIEAPGSHKYRREAISRRVQQSATSPHPHGRTCADGTRQACCSAPGPARDSSGRQHDWSAREFTSRGAYYWREAPAYPWQNPSG